MTDNRQPITEQDVLYVAELANLELTADEPGAKEASEAAPTHQASSVERRAI